MVLYDHIVKKVNCLYKLKEEAISRLKEKEQYDLLTDIEIPLSKVLGKMEFEGMLVDLEELDRQEKELDESVSKLEK